MSTDDRSSGEWPAKQSISQEEPQVIPDSEAIVWIGILSLFVLAGATLVYGLILHLAEIASKAS